MASKNKKAVDNEGPAVGSVVKRKDMVTVFGTGGKLKGGKPYKVHAIVAKSLVERGMATEMDEKAAAE